MITSFSFKKVINCFRIQAIFSSETHTVNFKEWDFSLFLAFAMFVNWQKEYWIASVAAVFKTNNSVAEDENVVVFESLTFLKLIVCIYSLIYCGLNRTFADR